MTGNNFHIDSASVSDRGLSEKRPQNEDSYLEMSERGLFAVADGVGGAQAGDVASQMAIEILGEAFVNLQKNNDIEELMKMAIERANEAIYRMSHDLAQLSTMATTIVALHIAGNIATIGHVGDSRLYRLDSKGSLYRETQDHSVVEEEVRAGRMTPEQAANHPSRNVISRALGADQTVEVDMKTIMIEPNTTFLLCSDGITRHIDDFQLRELLLSDDSPVNVTRRMKEICYERGAEDNLTAIIAKVTNKKIEDAPNSYIAANVGELEESTVAAVRPAVNLFSAEENSYAEIPTQPLVAPQINNIQANSTDSAIVPSQPTLSPVPPQPVEAQVKREIISVEQEDSANEDTSSGKMSRLLSSMLLLIVGGLAGAGAYYFLATKNPPPDVPQLTQQSPDIEFSSYESLRRSVDNDPNSFINKNANITQDAEGLYLLGRAYLLTGKYPEAKKAFEDAKNKLAQANQINSRVLTSDIAVGLAIVNETAAQTSLENQISPKNVQTPANVNSNMR